MLSSGYEPDMKPCHSSGKNNINHIPAIGNMVVIKINNPHSLSIVDRLGGFCVFILA